MISARRRPMIVAMAFGTLGDIIPVAVLVAKALAKFKPNSSITFITHSAHEFLRGPLASDGIAFKAISTPPVVSAREVNDLLQASNNGDVHCLESLDNKHHRECLEAVEAVVGSEAVGSQDLFLFNFFALEAWHLAEMYGVPCVVAAPYVVPYSAPSSFERQFQLQHGLLYERLKCSGPGEIGWPEVMHWMWPVFTKRWVAWRTGCLQMSPYTLTDPVTLLPISQNWPRAPPLLYGFSDLVVECPGYWPCSVHVCGFWFAPLDWWGLCQSMSLAAADHGNEVDLDNRNDADGKFMPPARLLQFLEDREDGKCRRPICFGMGSIGSMGLLGAPEVLVEVLKQVLQVSGQRAILLTSCYSQLDSIIMSIASSEADKKTDVSPTKLPCETLDDGFSVFGGRLFCYSGFVPYTWLFPRCLLAFHHGGSGTTAAALLSGIPQIICPFLLDQFYWADRMAWIGVAPEPIRPVHLFPSNEASAFENSTCTILGAIEDATSSSMQACAVDLALRLQHQDGIESALSVLQTAIE